MRDRYNKLTRNFSRKVVKAVPGESQKQYNNRIVSPEIWALRTAQDHHLRGMFGANLDLSSKFSGDVRIALPRAFTQAKLAKLKNDALFQRFTGPITMNYDQADEDDEGSDGSDDGLGDEQAGPSTG